VIRPRLAGWPTGLAATVLASASACAGLAPGGNIGPVVDVDGIGTAEVASFDLPDQEPDPNIGFTDRWSGATTVLATEDGQLLVVWNGGPVECWGLVSIHFIARGATVVASVGERRLAVPGECTGERRYRAVFVPRSASPVPGQTSYFPAEP
jgi:hypothetical protein